MRRRFPPLFAWSAAVAALAPLAMVADTAELSYRQDDETDIVTRAVSAYTTPLAQPPSGGGEVALKSTEKAFWFSMVGGKDAVLMVVVKGAEDVPPRLLVRTPGKNDFIEVSPAEEKNPAGELSKGYARRRFGPFELPVSSNKSKPRPRVMADVHIYPQGASFAIHPEGCFSGKLNLGDASYPVALVDANFSGTYEASSRGASVDKLFIDLNQDGRFDFRGECFPLRDLLGLEGRYYRMKPSADGKSIAADATEPACGFLEVGSPDLDLLLVSDTCCSHFSSSGAPLRLPAGRYSVNAFSLKKTDSSKAWVLSGSRPSPAMAGITIAANQTARVAMGAPLNLKVVAERASGGFSVNMQVLGQAGEQYVLMTSEKPPQFKIVDDDGRVLQSGKFEFG